MSSSWARHLVCSRTGDTAPLNEARALVVVFQTGDAGNYRLIPGTDMIV